MKVTRQRYIIIHQTFAVPLDSFRLQSRTLSKFCNWQTNFLYTSDAKRAKVKFSFCQCSFCKWLADQFYARENA